MTENRATKSSVNSRSSKWKPATTSSNAVFSSILTVSGTKSFSDYGSIEKDRRNFFSLLTSFQKLFRQVFCG